MASIRKRNGKFSVIFDYYDQNGERKQKSKTFSDEKEAKKFKNEVEGEKLHNTLVIPAKTSMKDYLAKWVEIYGKEKWQYQTYTSNVGLIKTHILPELGDVPMQNVTPLMIEVFIKNLKNKRVSGSKAYNKNGVEVPLLSSTTARHIYFILKTAFDKAVEWQMLKESPVKCTAPPKLKSNRKAQDSCTMRAILDDIKHKQLHLAVHLAFICSMRVGEVVGLTWECIDFKNGVIRVNKILQRVEKKALNEVPPTQLISVFEAKQSDSNSILILKDPKTERSTRDIFLTEPLKEELKERFEYLERVKQFRGGDEFTDYNFVFSLDDGYPVEPSLCAKWLRKWQKRTSLDVSGMVFHETRHSSTTYKLQISGGDIKAVQGDTGHATAAMVVDTYSHTMNDSRYKMMKRIEQDFYNEPAAPANNSELPPNMDDLIIAVKSNPEMQKKLLAALIDGTKDA